MRFASTVVAVLVLCSCASTRGGDSPDAQNGQNMQEAQEIDLSSLGTPQSCWRSERVNPEEAGTMIIQSTLTFYEGGAAYERILEFRANNPEESQKSRMLEVGTLTRTADGLVVSFENVAEYITAVEEGGRLLVRWSDASPSDPSEIYERTALN